jgi:hypothetical protein
MPLGRSEVGVAELDGKMYVVGGYARANVDQPLNQVYDPVADAWQTCAPLPRGLNHVAVVGFDHRLFAFRGFQLQNQSAVADVGSTIRRATPGARCGRCPRPSAQSPFASSAGSSTWSADETLPASPPTGCTIRLPIGGWRRRRWRPRAIILRWPRSAGSCSPPAAG